MAIPSLAAPPPTSRTFIPGRAIAMNAIELDFTLEQAAGRRAPEQRQAALEEEQAAGQRAVEAAKNVAPRSD